MAEVELKGISSADVYKSKGGYMVIYGSYYFASKEEAMKEVEDDLTNAKKNNRKRQS